MINLDGEGICIKADQFPRLGECFKRLVLEFCRLKVHKVRRESQKNNIILEQLIKANKGEKSGKELN